MKAKDLKLGMRFKHFSNRPPCTITSVLYTNAKGLITFTAVYDEPKGPNGNIYDVFWFNPEKEIIVL